MAARKAKTTKKSIPDFSSRREIFKNAESYKSLFYGVLTVFILFILGIGAVKLFLNHPKPEIDSRAVSVSRLDEAQREANKKTNMYTVHEDESLWDVAVLKYNDGDKWVEIARANNITNPDTIFKNDKLVIPSLPDTPTAQNATLQAPSSTPDITQAPSNNTQDTMEVATQGEKISAATYTVKAGDDLWDIAVRAYGDGYKWTEIANANGLSDPGLIFSDNVLKIPRD